MGGGGREGHRRATEKESEASRQQPSPHPSGVGGAGRMSRAWSSVGTCALSKLLSRHKLRVSDQVSSSAVNVGGRLLRSGRSVSKVFGCLVLVVVGFSLGL